MPKGKQLPPPEIIVKQADELKFASQEEAFEVVGPILARMIAQTILRENEEKKRKSGSKDHGED